MSKLLRLSDLDKKGILENISQIYNTTIPKPQVMISSNHTIIPLINWAKDNYADHASKYEKVLSEFPFMEDLVTRDPWITFITSNDDGKREYTNVAYARDSITKGFLTKFCQPVDFSDYNNLSESCKEAVDLYKKLEADRQQELDAIKAWEKSKEEYLNQCQEILDKVEYLDQLDDIWEDILRTDPINYRELVNNVKFSIDTDSIKNKLLANS